MVSVEEVGKAERQRRLKKRPASAMAEDEDVVDEAAAADAAPVLKKPASVMARPAAADAAPAQPPGAPAQRYGCSKCKRGRKGFEPYVIQILLIIILMSFSHWGETQILKVMPSCSFMV